MRRVISVGVLACFATTTAGQDLVAWKFRENQEFFVEQKLVQDQTVLFAGQKKDSRTSQSSLIRFNVDRTHTGGNVDLRMTVEKVTHDGGNANAAKLTGKMAGAEFQLTIDKAGKLVRLDGYSDFVKRIAEGDDRRATLFRAVLSEESFKKLAVQTFEIGPNRPVEVGESWEHKLKLPLGPFGSITFNRSIKHAGRTPEPGAAVKLEISGTAAYESPSGDFPGFPFKVTKGTFEFEDISGSATFDAVAGKLQSLVVKMQMTGKLTIEIGKSQQDVTITQRQTSTLRIHDKKPEETPARPGLD